MNFITKIIVGCAVALATAPAFVFGQNYDLTPNDTLIVNAPFNDLNHFTIQQNNLTSGSLVFSWQQILLDIPIGWEANLCDNGNCYPGFPLSGTMDTIFVGAYGLMSIGVDPDTISGTAIIQYAVWEESTPTEADTLTWIITANRTTGILETKIKNEFSIFPNAANNYINILTNLQKGFQYLIYDGSGKQVKQGNSNSYSLSVPLHSFANGNYTISIIDLNKNIFTKQFIIQHR